LCLAGLQEAADQGGVFRHFHVLARAMLQARFTE
jgi:hypothetical protein